MPGVITAGCDFYVPEHVDMIGIETDGAGVVSAARVYITGCAYSGMIAPHVVRAPYAAKLITDFETHASFRRCHKLLINDARVAGWIDKRADRPIGTCTYIRLQFIGGTDLPIAGKDADAFLAGFPGLRPVDPPKPAKAYAMRYTEHGVTQSRVVANAADARRVFIEELMPRGIDKASFCITYGEARYGTGIYFLAGMIRWQEELGINPLSGEYVAPSAKPVTDPRVEELLAAARNALHILKREIDGASTFVSICATSNKLEAAIEAFVPNNPCEESYIP